jgi:hypothetical protein
VDEEEHVKEFRNTILLVLVCLGLYTYLAIYEDSDQLDPDGPQRLLQLDQRDLVEIQVTRRSDGKEESYRLLLKETPQTSTPDHRALGEDWTLEAGGKSFRVDSSNMEILLKRLVEFEIKRTVQTEGKDLASFGLASPKVTLRWRAPGARNPKQRSGMIQIGGRSPVGSLRFTRVGKDSPVYASESWKVDALGKEAAHYRERRLFPDFDETKLQSVTIEYADKAKPRHFQLTPEDRWEVTSPSQFITAPEEFVRLVVDLKGLRAQRFLLPAPPEEDRYGFSKPSLRVTMRWSEGPPQIFEVGKTSPDRTGRAFVRIPGQDPVVVDEDLLKRLSSPLNSFRVKAILKEKLQGIERFTLKTRKDSYAFAKLGGPWKFLPVPEADVNDAVKVFLEELSLLNVDLFIEKSLDPGSFHLVIPPFRLVVPGSKGFEVLLSAGRTEQGHFLRFADSDTIYQATSKLYFRKLEQLVKRAAELTKRANRVYGPEPEAAAPGG